MEKEKHKLKQIIRGERFVNVPRINEVSDVLQLQVVADTYHVRGSGEATKELDEVITLHRKWVSEIIDLSDFPHCYFTHGVTDAIHHWVMTETREWQQLEGEYEYPQVIGTKPTVCCDVPRQHMNDLGRSAVPRKVDNDKPMYLSIPSAADGNYFDMGEINSPVILDCCYVGATDIKEIKIPKNKSITIKSIYGDLIASGEYNDVKAKITYGDIEMKQSNISNTASIVLSSIYGYVDYSVPKSANIEFNLSTSYGEILTDLDLVSTQKNVFDSNECNSSRGGKYTLNKGKAIASINSTYDDVYLRGS